MTKHRGHSQHGTAFVYIGIAMFALVGFTGLAVDLGRGYVIKANLSKAVDAAALAAARGIGEGQATARDMANNIFNVNFPNGYLGVDSVQNPPQIAFADAADQSSVITVSSRAVMSTTFMKIAGFAELGITAQSQATRRLVDLSFVVDHSNSLGSDFDQVKAAAEQFVSYFDPAKDRVALVMFASNTTIMDPINTGGRGFNKSSLLNHINGSNTTGAVSTATSGGLYAGWDQLRSVPSGSQAPLRVIVLFTDGAPNTFSGTFKAKPFHNAPGTFALVSATGGLFTSDYPQSPPSVTGLSTIYSSPSDMSLHYVSPPTNSLYTSGTGGTLVVDQDIPNIPTTSYHPPPYASSGIPPGFTLYDSSLPGQRVLIGLTASGYPDHPQNANNAARNLAEIIANAARADSSGAQPIRVYTLGLGDLLNQPGGSVPETGASILMRIANDPASASFNSNQAEGKYYFAGDTSQLASAFEAIRNQIVRLSQ